MFIVYYVKKVCLNAIIIIKFQYNLLYTVTVGANSRHNSILSFELKLIITYIDVIKCIQGPS